MEIIGLQANANLNKPRIKAGVKAGGSDFLKAFNKSFSTVKASEVQASYCAEQTNWKKKLESKKVDEYEEFSEEEVLYKEYKKLLVKLCRFKKSLGEKE